MQVKIITDSCSDLPIEYINDNDISVVSMTYHFKGREYADDFGRTISYSEFYAAVRNGEMSTTSQINVFTFAEEFKKHIKDGQSIIYIGFSSALSGSLNNALIAKDMVLKEYSNADISVIDSKSASAGEGLLVYYACEMLKNGKSKQEIVEWVKNNKLKLNHWFTVDSLNHLRRGGRVSNTKAFIGTVLDIKPVLHVDDEGRLIPVRKVKGRKKSIRMIANKFFEMAVKPEEQLVIISHGDCIEDANHLKELILKETSVKDIIITYIGPVIGAHSGPGTLALFFIGEKR
ncbi:MAG: DegV family protein [Clostridiales bacterium]|nr:DegV family protein [Clostridiales bacterium]HBM80425.1 fatty acid-binding protein DegV [Clostridiaceae bacterium]